MRSGGAGVRQLIARTDRGCVRERNEDVVHADPELGIALLADGMGGHRSGDLASRLGVDVALRHLDEALKTTAKETGKNTLLGVLESAIVEANHAILERAYAEPQHAGMGTTMVVAVFRNGRFYYAHVGDSRLYLLDGNGLRQLTEDHTYEVQLAKLGRLDEPLREPLGKMLVRAVGIESEIEVDSAIQACSSGELVLICSDGLTDMLTDDEIERDLSQYSDQSLNQVATQLIEHATAKGGSDNISVILAQI